QATRLESRLPTTAVHPHDAAELLDRVCRAGLLTATRLAELTPASAERFADPWGLAREVLRRGWLTPYQIHQLFLGRGQTVLLGPYVQLERLGAGGMGQVFKARHAGLDRVVALKVIRKDRLSDPDLARRFLREIRAIGQLSHPNIVLAYDAAEAGGTFFLAMEYIEGTDLKRLVSKRGPLPIEQACDYVRQAALGLQHAHERGLVHRDIKPSNLLLAKGETVKIADLGLARLYVGSEPVDDSTLTQEGMAMGTPDFMAPEQAEESHRVDIRGDIYSL